MTIKISVFVLAAAALLSSIATSAIAGDASSTTWEGTYVGGSVGYGKAKSNLNATACDNPWCDPAVGTGMAFKNTGKAGGIYGGINYQRDALVYGIEASAQLTGIKKSGILYGEDIGDDWMKSKVTSIMTLSGRVGHAWDQSLVYAKGGVALAGMSLKADDSIGINVGAGSDDVWRKGYVLGLGYEHAIDANWTVGVDVSHIQLLKANFNLSDPQGAYTLHQGSSSLDLMTVRAGYKF